MKLIRIAKGKEEVIETGTRQKLNDKLKTLRKSQRGGKVRTWRTGKLYRVEYKIVE